MAPHQDRNKKHSRKDKNSDQNMSKHSLNTSAETPICKYQDDKDFDEAFKNLLHPIESITKKNHYEPLQYNLLKELDSYLYHLKGTSDSGSLVFVEAALMIQNVILIYQKRVDQFVEVMMNLVAKFRAYRRNLNDIPGDGVEIEEGNKKKKKEKKIKFYPSFEPLKLTCGPSKIFDCKLIDLSKKSCAPKMVLNANIKVDNKYSKLLPYILIGNGENIGKKYDFMVNCPLNRDLAINEEFDCCTNEKGDAPLSCLNFQNDGVPPPMHMDIDVNSDDDLPATPDPVIFDQTVNDVMVPHAAAPPPANIIDTSKIPQITNEANEGAWNTVVDDNTYSDKPIINKKTSKKEDNGIWLPTYIVSELCCQLIKLKSGIATDPEFRKIVFEAREAQRSEISKKRIERLKAEDKKQYEEIRDTLDIGELGFKGFDDGDVDYNFNDNFEENQEQLIVENQNDDNFQAYQKNTIDMQKHEQNQLEIMNEQLEMRKRVQQWHDNLRPVLEAEEKRTEFDVHEYGTRVLNCFEDIGEQKLFKDLVGGLEQEEVARYFLSTLMMTNTCNVKITNAVGDPEMKIQLVKKERHHEQLQVNIGNQVNQDSK